MLRAHRRSSSRRRRCRRRRCRDSCPYLAADILRRATRHADGALEWIHTENRAEPYWRQSYTGYMQGAAGIGSLFVRLAAHDRKLPWKLRLPDNPLPIV